MSLKSGKEHKDKPGIPAVVRNDIQHIFQALSSEDLLKKCLHGKTQNNNESLNGFIWNRLPKVIFVGFYTLQMGVASAVIDFNSGAYGLYNIFDKLGMTPGSFTVDYCDLHDETRVKKMRKKMSEAGKKKRKRKRAIRKGFQVKDKDKEGDVYKCGMF